MSLYNFDPQVFKELPYAKRLSWVQTFQVAVMVILAPGVFTLSLLSYPFQTSRHGLGWIFSSVSNTLRFMLWAGSDEIMQKALGFAPLVVGLQSKLFYGNYIGKNNFNGPLVGAKSNIRWIYEVENRTAKDPVIYYVHGGAFHTKVLPAQVDMCRLLCQELKDQRVSCCMIDYSVVPYFKFPTQLDECYEGFQELSASCSRIIISGDSAGGNLACSLALLLAERKTNQHFWGFYVIAPWLDLLPQEEGTWISNAQTDWLAKRWLIVNAKRYAGTNANNKLCQPKFATAGDWDAALPHPRTICVYGKLELFAGASEKFSRDAKIDTVIPEEGGIHDHNIVFDLHGPANKLVVQTIKQWVQ